MEDALDAAGDKQKVYRKICTLAKLVPRLALRLALPVALLAINGCASNGERDAANGRDPQMRVPQLRAATQEETPDDIEPTVVAFRDYSDPLIGLNRAIFKFNDVSYRYVFIPIGKGYQRAMPEPVKNGVSNFFYNLKAPIYLVNNSLQLKPRKAGVNILRFGINSTLGLLGIFDPAQDWFDLAKADTDFEDTFAHYGAGYGVYLVVPFLGPSDIRSGTSSLLEGVFYPVSYLVDNPERYLIQGTDYLQEFSPQAELYERLVEQSDDPYIFFRNLYLQGIQRDAAYNEEEAE